MTDRFATMTSGEIAAEGGTAGRRNLGRDKDPQRPLDAELRAVVERLDGVVAAARLTKCPTCKQRAPASCPLQDVNCAAIKSGLAHLWSALGQADQAVAAAGFTAEETRT